MASIILIRVDLDHPILKIIAHSVEIYSEVASAPPPQVVGSRVLCHLFHGLLLNMAPRSDSRRSSKWQLADKTGDRQSIEVELGQVSSL